MLLLAYLSVHINPEFFSFPAFFGLGYPYILLLNIMVIIIWVVKLRPEAFISIAVIALGINHFNNYIRLKRPAGNKENSISVLSYNVHMFDYYGNGQNKNTEQVIIEFIKSKQPHIICFQEFLISGNLHLKENEIINGLGGGYFSHIKLAGKTRKGYYGIATYSRFPIVGKGEIIHPSSSSLSIFSDIIIGKDTFRVFNNHLQSFRLKRMERSMLDELASENNQTMYELRTISSSLNSGFKRRSIQSHRVKEQIDISPYPVIVAGDFNDTPVSYSYTKIRKGLNDAFVSSGYGAGFTYKGNYPPNRIDYILYDNYLTSKVFEVFKLGYSDHYPIMAYFGKD
jgi:endonuclease/exonuclease/phosphatase family metal-dependent hydrolase